MKNIAKRHEMTIWKALPYELFIRMYQYPFLRQVLKYFFRTDKPSNVFFVLGCYNSGTTVIKNAIALHSDIAVAPVEGDLLTSAFSHYEMIGSERCMYADAFQIMQDRKYSEVSSKQAISDWRPWISPGKFFLEKSISNTLRINSLRKAFPETKFICVTRNVEGVVRGINKRSSPSGVYQHILGDNQYSDNLLIRQWLMFYSLVLDDIDEEKADIYFVSYEKFLSSPACEINNIYTFLGLNMKKSDYESGVLNIDGNILHIREQPKGKTIDYLDSCKKLLSEINKTKRKL